MVIHASRVEPGLSLLFVYHPITAAKLTQSPHIVRYFFIGCWLGSFVSVICAKNLDQVRIYVQRSYDARYSSYL